MPEEKTGSVPAGSPIDGGAPNPNDFWGVAGEAPIKDAPVVPAPEGGGKAGEATPKLEPDQVKELESLVGRQGQELGEFRKFFTDIAPLLDKLDKSPEIVQAVVEGKITTEVAKAVMEGKVSIDDAKIVGKAHEEIKKGLGKEGYQGASPEEITKLVEDKAREIQAEVDEKLKKRDELNAFESGVRDFVARTSDFKEYAKEIDKWLDEHDVTDIAVAYYAVKGELSEKEAKKQAKVDKANAEKAGALNMGGGTGNRTHVKSGEKVIDSLIASKTNPNIF